MRLNTILEFAKKQGYTDVEPLGTWRGYDVYDLIYEQEDSCIGWPLMAMVKNDTIRLSTLEETMQYMAEKE